MSPPTSSVARRIDLDIMKLVNSQHKVILSDKRNEVEVILYGPKGTLYEAGTWRVLLTIPEKYPYKSPSVGFVNKIYHPNVDELSGSVCLNVISHTWTALYDLNMIFDTFLPQLLAYPNPGDPLNHEAATGLLDSPEKYKAKVNEYIEQFASSESLKLNDLQFAVPSSSHISTPKPGRSKEDSSSLSSNSEYEDLDMDL